LTRKHAHRKVVINTSALANTIANSQPTAPAEVARIMLMIRLAYEKLKIGNATDFEYDRVGAAVNVGLVRAESIGQPLVDAFKAAGEAMLECARRQKASGKYGFSGPNLLSMNAAMDLYEQLLGLSSPNQMHSAQMEAYRRLTAGEVITA
jgi:hypothetical protein